MASPSSHNFRDGISQNREAAFGKVGNSKVLVGIMVHHNLQTKEEVQ
jgi:hypothetical protein